MNIIELAIAAQLIDHRDTEESLPPDFVASLKEFAALVRAALAEDAESSFAKAEQDIDATRYRWLRDEAQWLEGVPQAIIWRRDGHAQEVCSEDELDEAIDAAIRALKEQA